MTYIVCVKLPVHGMFEDHILVQAAYSFCLSIYFVSIEHTKLEHILAPRTYTCILPLGFWNVVLDTKDD